MLEKLKKYRSQLKNLSALSVIDWALEVFGSSNILLASSLSAEDQVLTDMLVKKTDQPRIFTLDTGRLFQETYDVMQSSMDRYRFEYEVCFPETNDVMNLVRKKGPNLFYNSVIDRKECCYIRKVRPLSKILKTAQIWLTGLRIEQSSTRVDLNKIEWDESFGLYKLNPLALWNTKKVWKYIKDNNVPYNALHDKGFLSIGCAPCTRAIKENEEERKGRWWWENPETKECGIHASDRTKQKTHQNDIVSEEDQKS